MKKLSSSYDVKNGIKKEKVCQCFMIDIWNCKASEKKLGQEDIMQKQLILYREIGGKCFFAQRLRVLRVSNYGTGTTTTS